MTDDSHEQRIEAAREAAEQAFWAVVAQRFPEAKFGDFAPDQTVAFEDASRRAIEGWVENNVPQEATVYLRLGPGAYARSQSGEILETVEFDADGRPLWHTAGICDHRGAGPEAFEQLDAALKAAENNADIIGQEIKRPR